MQITATALAQQLGGDVLGDGATLLTGFGAADRAGTGDLTFA
ncbi:MAG: UDP-3-O-(3-hydroxymyristoyl)glucosamine N-acyltransferase, partial [Burkholderiales bacterium]|nr:UDP-3-O-(3-hydroxymyristoyl)glucosamine N-acyltransferase [Opitutaceae bacterium]